MNDYQKVIDDFVSKFPDLYVGLAIGIIDGLAEQDRLAEQMFFLGSADTDVPIKDNTLFEIGSVTKVFTSILLAKLAVEEKLSLDDPAQSALPDFVKLPSDGESEITFRHLAIHRSSLPRLPENLDLETVNEENPYVDYSVEDLYEYLNSVERVPKIGFREAYSNLGTGLLGHLLGRVDESDYDEAVWKHVLVPLGLSDTTIKLSKSQTRRLAQPHVVKDHPTQRWEFQDSTVAAGGIRSTLRDMMKFVKANLGPQTTPIDAAIRLTHMPMPPAPKPIVQRSWFGYLTAVILAMVAFLIMLGFNVQPGWFGFAAIVLAPTAVVAYLYGIGPMLVTTSLMAILTWLMHGNGFDIETTVLLSVIVGFGARATSRLIYPQTGKGRLAWQEMQIGNQEVLWHNGMVGGSASFVALIPKQNKGLVILTNTAVEVDTLGIELLHKLAAK